MPTDKALRPLTSGGCSLDARVPLVRESSVGGSDRTSSPLGSVISTACSSATRASRWLTRIPDIKSTRSGAPVWPWIYIDHASGAKASRPELDSVLRFLRDGDTLKITRLDRLGRSVLHLVTLGAELRERGVGLHVMEQGSTQRPLRVARCS